MPIAAPAPPAPAGGPMPIEPVAGPGEPWRVDDYFEAAHITEPAAPEGSEMQVIASQWAGGSAVLLFTAAQLVSGVGQVWLLRGAAHDWLGNFAGQTEDSPGEWSLEFDDLEWVPPDNLQAHDIGGGEDDPDPPSAAMPLGGDEDDPDPPAAAIPVPLSAPPAASMHGGDPMPIDGTGSDPSAPDAWVIAGEQPPSAAHVAPESPVQVSHTDTITADRNYRVLVGARAAPVTITLPNPGGDGQWVEIVDASLQASVWPVAVDPDGGEIEGLAGPHIINMPGGVVELYHTGGGKWKVL
jgi:hypothetical protein